MVTAETIVAESRHALCEATLAETLAVLHDTPSRAGAEARLARRVARWGLARLPQADWRVEPLRRGRANLRSAYPARAHVERLASLLYTHLDTSLSGDPALDHPLTGVARSAPRHLQRIDGSGELRGLGLAVSKAPAACALCGYLAVAGACVALGVESAPFGLLLAAGGTHRAPGGGFARPIPAGLDTGLGVGVEAALAAGLEAASVINVKGGAPGVLSEEPGCLLVRLEVRDRMVAVPARGATPGAAVRAARVAHLVDRWRAHYVTNRADPKRQIAPDVGVGAIESGLSYKPDILPGIANVYVYVVTLPEDDTDQVLGELTGHINRGMHDVDPAWTSASLSAHVLGSQPGASTNPDSRIVQLARAAWERRHGPGSSVVRGYTGSTDGVIFRRHGIPTVRLGVTPRALADDPTIEAITAQDMLAMTEAYVEILARLLFELRPTETVAGSAS